MKGQHRTENCRWEVLMQELQSARAGQYLPMLGRPLLMAKT
jgi:hypothetical protein